jgi:hypothetical protein
MVDPFELPPLGHSTKEDFCPILHLEIEPEAQSADGEDVDNQRGYYEAPPEEAFNPDDGKIQAVLVRDLHKIWLRISPDEQAFCSLLYESFQLGLDSLKTFERWGMHADLERYDRVLEPWDYRSYERWESPAEANEGFLNCDVWLQEKPQYHSLKESIESLLTQAMSQVHSQFEHFEPLLHKYWENLELSLPTSKLIAKLRSARAMPEDDRQT